jgi:D-alanine--poly(phosphoribitol) ligase subunit 1
MCVNNKSNILADILSAAARYPGNDAMVINGIHYSYKYLLGRAKGICEAFNDSDARIIGIIAENKIETYASILATLISGRTYVILHPIYPKERNQGIVQQTGLHIILHSDAYDSNFLDCPSVKWICTTCLASSKDEKEWFASDSKEYAYIIFTSGSTGIPKGVPISRKNLNAFYKAYCNLGWNLDSHDRLLQMFELTFDLSVVSFLYPLTIGACEYTVGNDMAKYLKVFDILESEHITFAALTASILQLFSPYFQDVFLPDLKYVGLTAEATNADMVRKLSKSAPNALFVNLYGPTETTIYCTAYFLPKEGEIKGHNGTVAIGKPFDGMSAIIADDKGKEITDGSQGELWISGPQVMDGYWKNPEKTAEAIVKTPDGKVYYRTGDICYMDGESDIIYCGRKDSQVKIQGFRIELGEIECAARKFLNYECNAVAFAAPFDGLMELHLVIETDKCDTEALMNGLRHLLPDYMVPKTIHMLKPFPTNTNNKIDRKAIKEAYTK